MTHDISLLTKVVSDFTGTPESDLGGDAKTLPQTAVAEALRVAAAQAPTTETGWRVSHVLSMRSWVIRKLRGLPFWEDQSLEETVLAVLSEGPGPNLEFLGDFISLRSGYYTPAPTRVVPIAHRAFLLVSGLPSRQFVETGLVLKFNGPCRWLVDCSETDLSEAGIETQTRENYLGEPWVDENPIAFLKTLLSLLPTKKWDMEPGSEAYLGHRKDSFDFDFEWGTAGARLNFDQGVLSIWRSPREFGRYDHFLRLNSESGVQVRRLRPGLVKRALLAFEAALGKARRADVDRHSTHFMLGLDFRPSAPMLRWMHAVGGLWRGSKTSRIYWEFDASMWSQLAGMLDAFWLESSEEGG